MSTQTGSVFLVHKGRKIRHVERHQGISMDHWYLDTATGREFDVRDLPERVIGVVEPEDLLVPDRQIHKKAIQAAIEAGHDFALPTTDEIIERADRNRARLRHAAVSSLEPAPSAAPSARP